MQDHDHQHPSIEPDAALFEERTDPASRSLNESLRISFGVLKLIMLVLVGWFIFSGVRQVPEGSVALRLHFGRVTGIEGAQVLNPGWHFAWPEPIDRVIVVPTGSQQVQIDRAFWFDLHPDDQHKELKQLIDSGRYLGPLTPGQVGTMITGDQNIVHAKWTIRWKVRPEDARNFIATISSDTTLVKNENDLSLPKMMLDANDFIRHIAERTLMHIVAEASVDDFLRGDIDRLKARRMLQQSLDDLNAGVAIEQVLLVDRTPPLEIREAFSALTSAESEKADAIEKARQEYQKIVNEAAGQGYQQLIAAIQSYEDARRPLDEARREAAEARQVYQVKPTDDNRKTFERLQATVDQLRQDLQPKIDATDLAIAALLESNQVAGEVSRVIQEAQSYKRTISENLLAEVSLFDSYHQVFKNNPQLRNITIARLWEDTRQEIFRGDVETFYLPRGLSELWLEVGRDPRVINKRAQNRQAKTIEEQGREGP